MVIIISTYRYNKLSSLTALRGIDNSDCIRNVASVLRVLVWSPKEEGFLGFVAGVPTTFEFVFKRFNIRMFLWEQAICTFTIDRYVGEFLFSNEAPTQLLHQSALYTARGCSTAANTFDAMEKEHRCEGTTFLHIKSYLRVPLWCGDRTTSADVGVTEACTPVSRKFHIQSTLRTKRFLRTNNINYHSDQLVKVLGLWELPETPLSPKSPRTALFDQASRSNKAVHSEKAFNLCSQYLIVCT